MAKPYSEILREIDNMPKTNDNVPGPEAANLQDIPQDLLSGEIPQEITDGTQQIDNQRSGQQEQYPETEEFREYYYNDDTKSNSRQK